MKLCVNTHFLCHNIHSTCSEIYGIDVFMFMLIGCCANLTLEAAIRDLVGIDLPVKMDSRYHLEMVLTENQ